MIIAKTIFLTLFKIYFIFLNKSKNELRIKIGNNSLIDLIRLIAEIKVFPSTPGL